MVEDIKSKGNKLEYKSGTVLTGDSKLIINIPNYIVMNKDMNFKRVMIYAFFASKYGLDKSIGFSLHKVIDWSGYKIDNHKQATNDQFTKMIYDFMDLGYLKYQPLGTVNTYVETYYNLDKIIDESQINKNAMIYLDEIKIIQNYKSAKGKGVIEKVNSDFNCAMLLVLAYLRTKIYKRKNEFFGTDEYKTVTERRNSNPEAYASYIKDIADDLGLSVQLTSRAITELENAGLIATYTLARTKIEENKYHTNQTIFCNAYKREGKYLLAEGNKYYDIEISNKINLITQYFK